MSKTPLKCRLFGHQYVARGPPIRRTFECSRCGKEADTWREVTRVTSPDTPRSQHDPEHSWRYRCPEGHSYIRRRSRKGGYYCHSCNEHYEGRPIDAKRGKR